MPPSATQHSHRDHSPGVHVTAAAQRVDDTLVADDGFCGLAVKQQAVSPYTTLPANYDKILTGEKYFILDSGEVDLVIPGGLSPAKGDMIWINTTTQALTKVTGAGTQRVGRVRYLGPERGLASNMMTISFEARKDGVAA